jgi:hypothetical protein
VLVTVVLGLPFGECQHAADSMDGGAVYSSCQTLNIPPSVPCSGQFLWAYSAGCMQPAAPTWELPPAAAPP